MVDRGACGDRSDAHASRLCCQNVRMTQRCQESIVVAATSARSLAELADQSGFVPIAMDVFGDRDTRMLAAQWFQVGSAAGLKFDPSRLLDALSRIARSADVAGWVAGSGFEAQLELLSAAARRLPLLGNAPSTIERVRAPAHFFPLLEALRIAHPETRVKPPPDRDGWLVKNAHSCGGWQVRPAGGPAATDVGGGRYFQRFVAGTPMSVLFLANRERARVIGFARQIVKPIGRCPFVFHGGVGPVDPPAGCRATLVAAIDALVGALRLVGLNGIDFILTPDGSALVLELNPRPTAATNLFPDVTPDGLLRIHVEACRTGLLPEVPPMVSPVRGFETVFAPVAGRIGHGLAGWMSATGWCRDLPATGTRYAWADPVCTVSVSAESPEVALTGLADRRIRVLEQLAKGEA